MIKNPCRQICRYDAEKICIGCGRTMEEAAGWIHMTDAEKLAVLERVRERKERVVTGKGNYDHYV